MGKLELARRTWTLWLATMVFACAFLLTDGTRAFALKERAPVAPDPAGSYASVIDSRWMELCLVDQPYSDTQVTNTDYYIITSTDDPDFSGGVTPILVHYRYFPEQAPYNSSFSGDIGKIQVFYRAYLKLPSSVQFKEGHTYSLAVNPAVANVGPFSFSFDLSQPNLVIHSNQVGYLPEAAKVAYLSHWTGQGSVDFSGYKHFYVVEEETGQSVFTGDIQLHLANDRWTKSDIYAMDFSAMRSEGRYHLYIPGIGVSYPFRISSLIYRDEIGYTITRAMFMQRDGNHGLQNPAYTHWNRPPAHLDDGIDQARYLDNGKNLEAARVNLTGGHMDAGDRGKYPYNSAYVGLDMLLGAKYFPEQVEALGESLDIPESNNGIPDYLDEMVYELDWLHKAIMNTSTDGTLANYLRPQSNDPETGTYETGQPLEGAKNRMFYNRTQGPNKAETLFAAGVMAEAYNSPIMKKYYSAAKLQGYLDAALRAYNGFKLHYQDPKYLKENTYYDASKVGTPHTWSNEMLLAASALMVATGNVHEYMPWIQSEMATDLTKYNSIKRYNWVLDPAWTGVFVSLYENPYLSDTIRQWAYGGILNYAESEMNHETPFGASAQDEGYPNLIGWRFTSSTLMPIVVGYGVTKNPLYLERLQKTWDYTLGSNAVSRSFITGLGDPQREPRWFVHEINQYQWIQHAQGKGGWVEPPPGLPNSDIQSAPYPYWFDDTENTAAKSKVFPSYNDHAVMYRYADSWNTQNEFSMNILSANAVSMLPLIPVKTYQLTVASADGEVLPAGGTYSQGTPLTLTAKGKVGFKFDHWSGDATGTASSIPITMDTNKSIQAHYVPANVYTLTVAAQNGSVQQAHSDGAYTEGDVVSLTAVPAYGYKFAGWSGDATGSDPILQVQMTGNKHITAQFVPLSRYTLSVAAQNGSVKVNPVKAEYLEGEEVILTANKYYGFRFIGWSGDYTETANPALLRMNGNKTITAGFAAIPTYPLTAQATEGGSVTLTPDHPGDVNQGLYEEGSMVTLTAVPQPGFLFTGWSGDVPSNANPLRYKVDGSKTFTAQFKPTYGLISVDVSPGAVPGHTETQDGVYTLTSSGTKFGVAPDSFRYHLRAGLKGEAVFTAKLDSFTGGNPTDAVAGLQIRTNLAEDSTYAAIMVKNGKLVVQTRKGGIYYDAYPQTPIPASVPIWLQIKRDANNRDITLSWSEDGTTWNSYNSSVFWGWNDPKLELTVGLFTSAGPGGSPATAQFSQVQWPGMQTLTVLPGSGGSITPESGLYTAGSAVKVKAVPAAGYAFAGWGLGLQGKANPNYITMNGDQTVSAQFSLMPDICILTVEPNITGGHLVLDPPGGRYAPNTVVRVTAVPDPGYSLAYWDGDLIGSSGTMELLMDGHKTISAKFVSYQSKDLLTTYAGSTVEDPNAVTMTASGSILWGESDSYRYTYQDSLNGDAVIIAKVTEFNGTAGNARAGIMVRQGTSEKNDYQGIFVTADRKIRSQFRNTKWTVAEYTGTESITLPVWLKVEKTGTRLTSYSSPDGVTWTQHGSQTLAALADPYTAGLAVTAGQDGKFVTARFGSIQWPAPSTYHSLMVDTSHGTVTGVPSGSRFPAGTSVTLSAVPEPGYVFQGWSGDLSGSANPAALIMDTPKQITATFVPENVPPIAFSTTVVGTVYGGAATQVGSAIKITGSGSNVWGQSDGFQYAYRDQLSGNVTLIARIHGITMSGASANSNTKAGIMIRQNTDANSVQQGIFIDGTAKIKSIYRDSTNGWSGRNYDGTVVETLPIWLKVEKIGNTVKTYSSPDGVTWTERSSRTLTWTGPFTAGLVVSAGSDGKFAEVTFTQVSWTAGP
ncbi:InlB B-repeat-containing protein [Gorillibacterium sp. sgz5001074]|uniref:InlB B-repeat-containing protein n=1 Tax=Gorillibacterium sp. sgz5001074 TaxID=3446695 RepID=UPI003F67E84B